MICRQCGQTIATNAEVCPKCGTPTGVGQQQAQPYPPQGSYPPPPEQPGGWGAAPVEVPNYLVQSILVTIGCCLPAGVAAIVFAAQANSKKAAGDYAGALDSAKKAKMWCWISLGIGLAGSLIYAIVLLAAGASDA
jgi:hypothetical protein